MDSRKGPLRSDLHDVVKVWTLRKSTSPECAILDIALESLLKMAVGPVSLPKMAATPEPPAIMDVKPQCSVIRDATSVFPVTVNVLFEDTQAFHMHLRLVSSGPTAGFGQSSRHPTSALVITETVPLSSVLPVCLGYTVLFYSSRVHSSPWLTCLQEEWDKITPETLHHLVSSVPKRLLSVVKRNGNITKW